MVTGDAADPSISPGMRGDRRGSNPRHLEPQAEAHAENAGNSAGALGQEGSQDARNGHDSRAGGGFAGDDLRSAAVAFLSAVRSGDDRAVDLAARLAKLVLGAEAVKLAQGVLEGGSLVVTRAIRLAEHVLSEAAAGRAGECAS